jgi:hypothetical protein
MLDESQKGLVKVEDSTWRKPAISVKGNFSWGFMDKQESIDEVKQRED